MPAASPFAELLACEGVDEVVELGSSFGFMAFHGGSLERQTDVVAAEAARRSGASLYAVIQPPDLRWHVPSQLVSPEHSDRLAEFLDHVDVAVAVHGYGRVDRWTELLIGGTNRDLATGLAEALRPRLPDYAITDDLELIPPELRGMHRDNPVNRPTQGGVQLELPPRVRGLGPTWAHWTGPELAPPTDALVDGLADVARRWHRG